MNVLLWDVPRHLEDYNSLAAMEPRAFQGLFQDTKLNQNDLTEKKNYGKLPLVKENLFYVEHSPPWSLL